MHSWCIYIILVALSYIYIRQMHFQPYSCQRFEFVLLVLAFTGNLLVDSQLKLLGNCLYITAAK